MLKNFGALELVIILVIVLLVFGATRLRDVGKGFGGAIRAFRSEVRQGKEEEEQEETSA
jgi:sec-independent protein translocase protein TatA